MKSVIANGRIGPDAAFIWFLWNPFNWRFWRWPHVERMGRFGRYEYRWRIGPLDGKWRNHPPERMNLRQG